MEKKTTTRRSFLQRSAAMAAAAPWIVPASALGRDGRPAPSERITIGMIGVGAQGTGHTMALTGFSDVQVLAVCDPQPERREAARTHVETAYGIPPDSSRRTGCTEYVDFRELLARDDIDAVFITSPEHWHGLQAIGAARAGKDMHVEKALTVTIAEGREVVRAVQRHGRVFQTGTQQRSSRNFRHACELVRNEAIGKLRRVRTGLPKGYPGPVPRIVPAPAGLDWDWWVGPSVWRKYSPDRITNLTGWMLDYDRCVGFQAGWGQHHNDIAQWGMGADDTGPVEIEGVGEFATEGMNSTVLAWRTEFLFRNGVELIFSSEDRERIGIRFEGDDGWVFVNRQTIEASDPSLLRTRFGASDIRLHESNDHRRDFIDAVKSRGPTVCPVEAGHRAASLCNLSDIAIRLGRRLRWDPDAERFVDDPEADRWLVREMRAPWSL